MADKTRRRRRLSPEERRLWEHVAATTAPLWPQSSGPPPAEPPALPPAPPAPAPSPDTPTPKRRGAAPARHAPGAPDRGRPPGPRPAGAPPREAVRITRAAPEVAPVGRPEPGLDRRTADRLRKGAREPDARIDLHGMTAARAHTACLRFLGNAAARGDRVVLVITGKGRRDEHGHTTGRGILRAALPGWLSASPLGHSIVGIYQAHRRHGGEGAVYVYLRRRR